MKVKDLKIDKMVLLHWWHYYGKCIYTLEELEEYEKIIDKYGEDKIFDLVIAAYLCGDGSPTVVLFSIRNGKIDEMIDSLPKKENMTEIALKQYEELKFNLYTTITSTMVAKPI